MTLISAVLILVQLSNGHASVTFDCGSSLRVHQLQKGSMGNFQYVIESDASAVIVDAAWDVEGIIAYVRSKGLKLLGGLYTHHHFDHVGGVSGHKRLSGAAQVRDASPDSKLPLWIGAGDADNAAKTSSVVVPSWNMVEDGDVLDMLGASVNVVVIKTPGHTSGGVSYLVRKVDPGDRTCPEGVLLTGDTLFSGSVGRTDLPGGDRDELLQSLARVAQLPSGTVVLPGHNYGNGPQSSIAGEIRSNDWMRHARQAFGTFPPPLPRAAMIATGRAEL